MKLSTYEDVNVEAKVACKARWDSLAKPLGSLGDLEEYVVRIAGLTGDVFYTIDNRAVIVFCADNGVVNNGVSQAGMDVTNIVASGIPFGKTAICVMAKIAKCEIIPVDMGIAVSACPTGLKDHRIAPGTQDIVLGPAMSREQAIKAIETGICLVEEQKYRGYRILAQGEVGIGNTTTASALASFLLDIDPAMVTGRGAGLDDEGFSRKVHIIRKAINVNHPDRKDPLDILAKLGGFDIAAMVGMCLGGAIHRIPIILDGVISDVAALLASRLDTNVTKALIAGHLSTEPAAKLALNELGLPPLINAHLHLGEGTGAVAALSLLDHAYAVYQNMSTINDMAITSYQPI